MRIKNVSSPLIRAMISDSDIERFWRLVRITDDCWLWLGSGNGRGYGGTSIEGNTGIIRAHRFSWVIHFGDLARGEQVLHTCDVRRCVNPHHLFKGDDLSNAQDRHQKGRDASHKGESNGCAVLTWQQVCEMRGLRLELVSQKDLAERFRCSKSTVANVCSGYRMRAGVKEPCWQYPE
jgi:hypothetical protein